MFFWFYVEIHKQNIDIFTNSIYKTVIFRLSTMFTQYSRCSPPPQFRDLLLGIKPT